MQIRLAGERAAQTSVSARSYALARGPKISPRQERKRRCTTDEVNAADEMHVAVHILLLFLFPRLVA